MSVVGTLHNKLAFNRRVRVLSEQFASLVPSGASVLDVGCGDGLVSALLQSQRPDVRVCGVDVLVREHTHIPMQMFDGHHLPFEDSAFDVVLFSDVLHHTVDPSALQREARRVAREYILVKDHFRKGFAAGVRLRFMDWVGNARFGVALPYNYWTEQQWEKAWEDIGLQPQTLVTRLCLYPALADWVFGAHLHFIALLKKCDPARA